jgi:hypothetical protein
VSTKSQTIEVDEATATAPKEQADERGLEIWGRAAFKPWRDQ